MNIVRIIERIIVVVAIAFVLLFLLMVLIDKKQQRNAYSSLKHLQHTVYLYESTLQQPLHRCASAVRYRYQKMWLRKIIRSAETAWYAELQQRHSRPAVVQTVWVVMLQYRHKLQRLQATQDANLNRDCHGTPA